MEILIKLELLNKKKRVNSLKDKTIKVCMNIQQEYLTQTKSNPKMENEMTIKKES